MPDRGEYVAGQPPEPHPLPPHRNGGLLGVGRDLLKQVGLTGERLVLVVVLFVFLFFIWLYLSQDRSEIKARIEGLQKSVESNAEALRSAAKDIGEIKGQSRVNEHFLRQIGEELKRIQGKKPDEVCPGWKMCP